MTITTTDTVERYVGDGTQTAWPIRFPFFKGEDVKACIVNSAGEQVNLVYGTEYTVTKATGSIGGTLNYALANDVVLTIWLSLPITQGADFYNTGPLNAETLEASFDRLTLIAQQLQEASDRSVKVATSSTETPEQLLASLYAGRDAAVLSASAAATSESNALASKQAAATSETNAAASKTAAAGSAITAQTWAESETPPDPNDAGSKSAKSWALVASDSVPIASATIAGKAKTSASWQVDPATGIATVPAATTELAGIARQATDNEVEAGTENGPVFVTPYGVQQKINALSEDVGEDLSGKADVDLSNVSDAGKASAVGWRIPSDMTILDTGVGIYRHSSDQGSVIVFGGKQVLVADAVHRARNKTWEDAVSWCAGKTIGGLRCYLPDLDTLSVIRLNGTSIDSYDPTASSNPTKKLGSGGSESTIGYLWSTTHHDKISGVASAWLVNVGGGANCNGSLGSSYGALPCLEL